MNIQNISIDNMHTLSANIKFICTSFRKSKKREPLAGLFGLFRSECK